jgi:hypothetical protein
MNVVETSGQVGKRARSVESGKARTRWLVENIEQGRTSKIFGDTFLITPEIADEILTHHNNRNRPLSPAKVEFYEREMLEGRFILSSQGMAFDKDGNLSNGQHRSHGIRKTGMSFEVFVAFGEDLRAFATHDTAKPRKASDALHIAGFKTSSFAASAAIRCLMASREDDPRGRTSYVNSQVVDFRLGLPSHFDNSVRRGAALSRSFKNLSDGGCGAAHFLIHEKSARLNNLRAKGKIAEADARLEEFWEGLREGAELPKTDPRFVLRAMWNRGGWSTGWHNRPMEVCSVIVLTWNLWVTKQTRTRPIKWDEKDPNFPRFPDIA